MIRAEAEAVIPLFRRQGAVSLPFFHSPLMVDLHEFLFNDGAGRTWEIGDIAIDECVDGPQPEIETGFFDLVFPLEAGALPG